MPAWHRHSIEPNCGPLVCEPQVCNWLQKVLDVGSEASGVFGCGKPQCLQTSWWLWACRPCKDLEQRSCVTSASSAVWQSCVCRMPACCQGADAHTVCIAGSSVVELIPDWLCGLGACLYWNVLVVLLVWISQFSSSWKEIMSSAPGLLPDAVSGNNKKS